LLSFKRMNIIKTVTISSLPRLRDEYLSGDDIIPIVDTGTGTNKTVTVDSLASFASPIGSITSFVKGSNVPSNFLPCDGRTVNTGSYIDLFKIMPNSARFGDTFALPNLTHTDANLSYYICTGDQRPAIYTPVLSGNTSQTSLTALTSIPSFNINVSINGGSATILQPYLSGFVVVSPGVFNTSSSLNIATANTSNASIFVDANTPFKSLLTLSNTGSDNFGFYDTNVQAVTGGTRFAGINTIKALELCNAAGQAPYLVHLPFVLKNIAVGTVNYNNYLATTPIANRGVTNFTFEVPAFEYTVSDKKYTLKTFVITKNQYTPFEVFHDATGNIATRVEYCDKFLSMFNPAVSSQNIAFNSTLSAALGNSKMRAKFKADGSTFFGGLTTNSITWLSGGGWFQKPFLYRNPIRIDNEWGWPVDSRQGFENVVGTAFATNGIAEYKRIGGTELTNWMLSGAKTWFYNNADTYGVAVSGLKYTYKTLGIGTHETLTNTATATNGSKKFYSFSVPFDNQTNKLIVTYYAN
jgi:hypothetical protein